MSEYLGGCWQCGADDASPCNPGCPCESCVRKAIGRERIFGEPLILADSVEGALDAANRAEFAGNQFEAQAHMVRLRHIASGA